MRASSHHILIIVSFFSLSLSFYLISDADLRAILSRVLAFCVHSSNWTHVGQNIDRTIDAFVSVSIVK